MRWTVLVLMQLLAPAHGRTFLPGRGRVRETVEADAGIGGPLRTGRERVLAPALAVRAQLDKMPDEWKDRLRTCRGHLGRCLALVKRRPRASLGVYLLWRLVFAHARIQTSKRLALRAFRRLGAKDDPAVYHITIVTTAALPWKTGTAVNALLRAAYLAELGHNVTLCVPWIHPEEQSALYPDGQTFADPRAQEEAMREWLQHRDGEHASFRICFYPARYDVVRGSILPLGDTTKWTGPGNKDLCVLEEPEHLNWYHGGVNWRQAFKLTIGVVHTNYVQ